MNHITKIISDYIYQLKYEDIPSDVLDITKMYIVDYFAACFAGMKVNKTFNKAVESMLYEMGGKEESSVLCNDSKLPTMNAAYMNAVYAHGADMDDGNRKAMGHVAAHVISTALAMGEKFHISGKDFIVAVNVGYEVYNRLAAAVQPGLVHRGFHSTGTAGALAAGAVAAKIMGFNSEQIYDTLALCAIQASGLILIAESGQSCKPINPANASRTGILSAELISRGVKSSQYPLESKKGWFHAMSDLVDESAVLDTLGKVFTITESYLKPYPSCRHTHCGIECALKIRKRWLENHNELCSSDVSAIRVYIYRNAIQIAGQIIVPKSDDDSKFSIHYSLATALLKGHFSLEDLSVQNMADDFKSMLDRIQLVEDASMENTAEGIRGCRVAVDFTDGTKMEETVLIPKGDAANPFTWADIENKLRDCSTGIISDEQRKHLVAYVQKIEQIPVMNSINTFLGETNV